MSELSKQELYESVKTLIELEDKPHLHLAQHKLFTLFSIGFQYFLYSSTKKPGHYIVRVEDGILLEKLAKKAKDPATRKFMQALMIPRKLSYGKSVFYLDFFAINSWNMTKDLPKEKVRGALIVKNNSLRPMNDRPDLELGGEENVALELPKDYYFSTLQTFVPKTVTIAYEETIENAYPVHFPFIKKERPKSISGVTLSKDIAWDEIDD